MANPAYQPRVEDYHSEDEGDTHHHVRHDTPERPDPILEQFRNSSSPAANVAAKRSHPSDLGRDKSPPAEKVAHIDLQSDSGYSSHYAGTMSSADSALSSPPSAPASAASVPPTSPAIKRRPTLVGDDRKNSSQSSPRKPLRSGSVSTRKPKERRKTGETEECTDPNCKTCGPNAVPTSSRGRRPEPLQRDSALDVSYPRHFDVRSQRSDPAPMPSYFTTPQSPTFVRPGSYMMQGQAVVTPAQSTRRRSSSTNRTTRPLSYHGGDPGNYWVPGMPIPPYTNPQDNRGPPPSMSAYHMHQPPPMAPYMPPSAPTYYSPAPGHPIQMSPPYDGQAQRPSMHTRTSSTYNTRGRPASGYGPPVVTQDQGTSNMPSARYAQPQSARQERPPPEFESDSSEYESSEEEEEVVEVRNPRNKRNSTSLMPPPPPPAPKASSQRRPSLRHAATTQVYNSDRRMSQSQTLPERPRERDIQESRPTRMNSTRAPSKSRPALVQHPKAQSAFESNRNAQVVQVENPRSARRQTYQYDKQQFEAEEKAKRRANRSSTIYAEDGNRNSKMYTVDSKRSSKVYAEDSNRNSRMYAEDAIVPARRRQTESDGRRPRDEPVTEPKNLQEVEAYLRSTRGSNEPLSDKVHKAAKRQSRVISGPSEAESSRSKGSDKSRRTTVTNGANGEIRLLVDASAPLSLSFNGDMEGRTLHIQPAENGMANIVIGNPGSRTEKMYSQSGSVLAGRTPKAIMGSQARRDAEEASVTRSERSSRTGRQEKERRVLQRRRPEVDYDEYD